MKVLLVSCLLPYPTVAHGGGTDLFHLIDSLSRRHEVHLISLVSEAECSHVAEIAPFCASTQVVVPSWTWGQKLRQAWRGLWTDPLSIGRRARGLMRTYIRRSVVDHAVDVVQFEWTETGQFVDALRDLPTVKILDEVDVSFRPLEHRAGQAGNPLHRAWLRRLSERRKREELLLCRSFDAILARSDFDRDLLRASLPDATVETFGPWTHIAEFADIGAAERRQGRLLFVGAMDREENCAAALYFYHRIFPHVRARKPAAEFWIAGAHPPPAITQLAQDPGVTVTGFVEDLKPLYARCDVFVAPLLVPGGIFNKILDAMGAGRPVVTTSLGNEGIAAPRDTAVRIADEPSAFADEVVALMDDDALWRQVAEGGRIHVRGRYDWPANVARLEAMYERLLERSRQPHAPGRTP